ncbi:hypothetical protein CRG98_033862 [Punica granatum]|uniref:Uncharacterized protein n=1 Tax=Punica granatum TaxID=22663 RepID=A0A2I0IP00_PUNGR|nr:hypothetical protein CRG98_033862 [Punica granatum]
MATRVRVHVRQELRRRLARWSRRERASSFLYHAAKWKGKGRESSDMSEHVEQNDNVSE